jgi:hypothetical protein
MQVLALYGEEAKNVGVSLHEVAQDLLQTDHHLRADVEELGTKIQILDGIISGVSASRGAKNV